MGGHLVFSHLMKRLKLGSWSKSNRGGKSVEETEVSITGGETPSADAKKALTVTSEPTPFGVENFEFVPENENGSLDTQAGSHPYQLTTTLTFNGILGKTAKDR